MSLLVPFADGNTTLTDEEMRLWEEYMDQHPYIKQISAEKGSFSVPKEVLRIWLRNGKQY